MKLNRSPQSRRRNPLMLPAIILVVLLAVLLAWFWSRGGDQPQRPVVKLIPAERLGR